MIKLLLSVLFIFIIFILYKNNEYFNNDGMGSDNVYSFNGPYNYEQNPVI